MVARHDMALVLRTGYKVERLFVRSTHPTDICKNLNNYKDYI